LIWILELLKKQGVKVDVETLADSMPKYLDQQSIKYLFEVILCYDFSILN